MGDAHLSISKDKLPANNPGDTRVAQGLAHLVRNMWTPQNVMERTLHDAEHAKFLKWKHENEMAVAMDQFRVKITFSEHQRGAGNWANLNKNMKAYLGVSRERSAAIEQSLFKNIAAKAKRHSVHVDTEAKKKRLALETKFHCQIGLWLDIPRHHL
jgi:hypothetical protein